MRAKFISSNENMGVGFYLKAQAWLKYDIAVKQAIYLR